MKLLRYGPAGKEKPGMLDANGKIRSLHKKLKDITAETLASGELAKLRKINPEKLPLVGGKPRLGIPYSGITKIIAVGLNYADHAAEAGMALPGLYPPNEQNKARYEAWVREQAAREKK